MSMIIITVPGNCNDVLFIYKLKFIMTIVYNNEMKNSLDDFFIDNWDLCNFIYTSSWIFIST